MALNHRDRLILTADQQAPRVDRPPTILCWRYKLFACHSGAALGPLVDGSDRADVFADSGGELRLRQTADDLGAT